MISMDLIILAGGPRLPPIVDAIGWPLASLPISSSSTVLEGWLDVVRRDCEETGEVRLERAMMLVSEGTDFGTTPGIEGLEITRESRSHRGTAGAVADELMRRPECDSDLVLVVELSASPAIRLTGMLRRAARCLDGDSFLLLAESRLGRYCGVTACHRRCFDRVPPVGFFDLKEQLLPALRHDGTMIDAELVAERAMRTRTRSEWLRTVEAWSTLDASRHDASDVEGQAPARPGPVSVIMSGARAEGATVVSSIVMDGAVVEPGAVVARSVIGPGMRVRARSRVVDAVVADPSIGRSTVPHRPADATSGVGTE